MNLEPCKIDTIMERALLSNVDLKLIKYFNSLIKNVPEGVRALHYKSDVLNEIVAFYFSHKDLFNSIPGTSYKSAFTAEYKTLSFRLNDDVVSLINEELLIFHRARKEQIEFILTSCFLLYKIHGITQLNFKKEAGLIAFKSNKPYTF